MGHLSNLSCPNVITVHHLPMRAIRDAGCPSIHGCPTHIHGVSQFTLSNDPTRCCILRQVIQCDGTTSFCRDPLGQVGPLARPRGATLVLSKGLPNCPNAKCRFFNNHLTFSSACSRILNDVGGDPYVPEVKIEKPSFVDARNFCRARSNVFRSHHDVHGESGLGVEFQFFGEGCTNQNLG